MNINDIKKLKSFSGYPCLSIFFTTHRNIPEKLQSPINMKNVVGEAITRLLKEKSKEDLAHLTFSLDEIVKQIDFTRLLDGIAIFITKNFIKVFILPFPVKERVVIDDNFFLRDILLVFNRSPRFYVLLLQQKGARFFEASRDHISEVFDPEEIRKNENGFPFDYPWDVVNERKLNAVSMGQKDSGYLREHMYKIFDSIDKILGRHLKENSLPYIVIATEKNFSEFGKNTKNLDRMAGHGSIDFRSCEEKSLLKKSWSIMKDYVEKEREKAEILFNDAVSRLNHSFGLQEVWRMNSEGRIHMLLVEEDFQVPGRVSPEDPGRIIIYDEKDRPKISDDLVDNLVISVLEKGGRVVFVKPGSLKEYQHIGAILRL